MLCGAEPACCGLRLCAPLRLLTCHVPVHVQDRIAGIEAEIGTPLLGQLSGGEQAEVRQLQPQVTKLQVRAGALFIPFEKGCCLQRNTAAGTLRPRVTKLQVRAGGFRVVFPFEASCCFSVNGSCAIAARVTKLVAGRGWFAAIETVPRCHKRFGHAMGLRPHLPCTSPA